MGIFSIKKNNKSKESSLIKDKSKRDFRFSYFFTGKNKKKNSKKYNATDGEHPKEQGYCFVSYSKSLTISPASSASSLINDDSINTSLYEDHEDNELKEIKLNQYLEEKINDDAPLKKDRNSLVYDSNPPDKTEIESIISRPKHRSAMDQLNDFLVEEKNNGLNDSFVEEQNVSFASGSCILEKSNLNTEEQNNTQNIEEIKTVEMKQNKNSTQEKDTDSNNVLISETNINNTSSSEIQPELINNCDHENIKTEDVVESEEQLANSKSNSQTQIAHEKRKRENTIKPSQGPSVTLNQQQQQQQQQKKIKKEDKKSIKDPNFVNNNKKRMGMITGRSGPYNQDTSIVQGVKGPWKIVETTTLTTGIVVSPEIIKQTFGNDTVPSSNDIIFQSSSLPSLTNTNTNIYNRNKNNVNINKRHQVKSDSLLVETNIIKKKNSQSSFDDYTSLSDGDNTSKKRNSRCSTSNYSYNQTSNVIKGSESSVPIEIDNKKSNSKLSIKSFKNKSFKNVFKHENKNNLKVNTEKRSPRMTNYDSNNSHVQSQSGSYNTTDKADNEFKNDFNSNMTPITTIDKTESTININNEFITTTDLKIPNQSGSLTLFQDTSNAIIDQQDSSNVLAQDNNASKDPEKVYSLTVIKYQLNKPSYLENEKENDAQWKSKDLKDTKWNNRVTMETRYFLNPNKKFDKNQEECYLENVKCILEQAHKLKDTQHNREIWSKNSKNNQDGMEYYFDLSFSFDSMVTMASTRMQDDDQASYDLRQSIKDSIFDNYNLGLSYINNGNNNNKQENIIPIYEKKFLLPATISSPLKNGIDIDVNTSTIEIPINSDHQDNKGENIDLEVMDNQNMERNEEANTSDDTFTSLEFKDEVISRIENDIASNSQINNNTNTNNSNSPSIVPKSNSIMSLEKSKEQISLKKKMFSKKGKTPSSNDTSMLPPKLINVPGESSMVKAYSMEENNNEVIRDTFYQKSDISSSHHIHNNTSNVQKSNSTMSIEKSKDQISHKKKVFSRKGKEPFFDDTYTSAPKLINVPGESSIPKAYTIEEHDTSNLNASTSGNSTNNATAANDSYKELPIIQDVPENNRIKILSSQYTQKKTSTYSYFPKELIESSDKMNIANFQIHTCRDSVLSPLIPCVACSNEKKWNNRRLSTRIRQSFKNWIVNLTHHKHKDKNSVVYSSSATLSIPIYFGDQMAIPKNQNKRHRPYSYGGSSSILKPEKKWKFKHRSMKNSPSSPYYPEGITSSPGAPSINYVFGKQPYADILPIPNDINKKNSCVCNLKTPSSTHSTIKNAPVPSISEEEEPQENMSITKSRSQKRPNPKSRDYYKNKHKGIIYYNKNRNILEKDAISRQSSNPNLGLDQNEELKRALNNIESLQNGNNIYNKNIFSNPITPELTPAEVEFEDNNVTPVVSKKVKPPVHSPKKRVQIKLTKSQSINKSKSLQSLYKEVCDLGLGIDRLAEKYDTSNLKK